MLNLYHEEEFMKKGRRANMADILFCLGWVYKPEWCNGDIAFFPWLFPKEMSRAINKKYFNNFILFTLVI